MALKVIRLQEEEGTPFTAIREGTLPILIILVSRVDSPFNSQWPTMQRKATAILCPGAGWLTLFIDSGNTLEATEVIIF